MPWKFGPCWRVQKALDGQGIAYEVVAGPSRPKKRTAVIDGTGQQLYPAIRFDDGSWYREESKDMARTINAGELTGKKRGDPPQGSGVAAERSRRLVEAVRGKRASPATDSRAGEARSALGGVRQ
jgi:hypothetical protein